MWPHFRGLLFGFAVYYHYNIKKLYKTGSHAKRNHLLYRHQNWSEAVKWYRRALAQNDDMASSEVDFGLTEPNHSILARMADMYQNGGHSLDKDPQTAGELYSEAAEAAMSAMKGKLSTKYFMLAEEAWSEMED